MTQDLYTCLDCFNDFPVSEGTLIIHSETFHEFTCHACEKLPSVSCGACGEFYKASHKCDVPEDAGLKEYEVQVSINSFAYIVVLAKDEEHAEEVADSKPWSEWKLDTDFSSADSLQVREMDGEGGYMTAEERANSKN